MCWFGARCAVLLAGVGDLGVVTLARRLLRCCWDAGMLVKRTPPWV
jgi:hypothetical protein